MSQVDFILIDTEQLLTVLINLDTLIRRQVEDIFLVMKENFDLRHHIST